MWWFVVRDGDWDTEGLVPFMALLLLLYVLVESPEIPMWLRIPAMVALGFFGLAALVEIAWKRR